MTSTQNMRYGEQTARLLDEMVAWHMFLTPHGGSGICMQALSRMDSYPGIRWCCLECVSCRHCDQDGQNHYGTKCLYGTKYFEYFIHPRMRQPVDQSFTLSQYLPLIMAHWLRKGGAYGDRPKEF